MLLFLSVQRDPERLESTADVWPHLFIVASQVAKFALSQSHHKGAGQHCQCPGY